MSEPDDFSMQDSDEYAEALWREAGPSVEDIRRATERGLYCSQCGCEFAADHGFKVACATNCLVGHLDNEGIVW